MLLLTHQLLLLASIAALSAAGWRIASAAVPSGLLRAVATATLVAGAAVLSALALALLGLGGSPVALTAVAGAICAVTWRVIDRRPPSAWEQLVSWWSGLPAWGRAGRAAVAGALIGYGAWVLRHPTLGLDALTYHLALPVDWVHNGRPGSLVAVNDALPIENYPLTWEVLVSWFTGIARTLVPATLMTLGTLVLLGASVRAALGAWGVSARLAWLAAAGLTTLPIVVVQLTGPNNDLPELAWLACVVALVAGATPWRAERHGGLLAAALIAAGLCLGTKTTAAPLALLALALGGWWCRGELRGLVVPLVLAAALAAVIGGVWYARNLFDHGAPFWPFSRAPGGDPLPAPFRVFHASLLSNLGTLNGRLGAYWNTLAGGVVLLAGALLAPLWAPRRAVFAGAAAVVAALLLWAGAPYTGFTSSTYLAVGATRYLLPCLLAAAVTIALAGRDGRRGAQVLAATVFLAAIAVNLDKDAPFGYPNAPSARLLLLAAALGGLLAVGAELLVRALPAAAARWRRSRWAASTLAVAVAAAGLAVLIAPVDGYLAAHAGTGLVDAGLVRWLDSRAAFRDGGAPVAISPVALAVLTGDRLAHRLVLVPTDERCPAVNREAGEEWVVIALGYAAAVDRHLLTCLAGRRPAYADPSFLVFAPSALAAPVR